MIDGVIEVGGGAGLVGLFVAILDDALFTAVTEVLLLLIKDDGAEEDSVLLIDESGGGGGRKFSLVVDPF